MTRSSPRRIGNVFHVELEGAGEMEHPAIAWLSGDDRRQPRDHGVPGRPRGATVIPGPARPLRRDAREQRGTTMPKAAGIDLGTTNSVIAAVEGGKATVIPNAEG